MIKIENIEVFNLEGAFRGLRNPMDSWDKSDSYKDGDKFVLGPKDLNLACRMIDAGAPNDKFMRQILVSMDITAPFYLWKEIDTYKVATVANSCSTMHKLTSYPITIDNFSFDITSDPKVQKIYGEIAGNCEYLRQMYLKTKDKTYWRALVQILPEGWNQKRTWTANYQTLQGIYQWRWNHKLEEWHDFCHIIRELPYGEELICRRTFKELNKAN